MGLFSQKDLIEAIEKAERRVKREKKEKEYEKNHKMIIMLLENKKSLSFIFK